MLQRRNVVFIALLLTSVIWWGCSDLNQNTPLSPEQSTTDSKTLSKNALAAQAGQDNQMLPAFAKKLALAAANTNLCAAIMQALSQSSSGERIVSLKDMLQMKVAANTFAAAISVSGEFIDAINAHPFGIDVYFPVKAHRQTMMENPQQNFLVTYYDGYEDEQVEKQFTAWDRQGNEVTLSTAVAPEIPVLVITPCEHNGKHPLVTCSDEDCGGGGGGGGGGGSRNDLILDAITIYNDHEPWYKGSPEIKMLTWQDPNNANYYNYQKFVDLASVDDENQTYYPNVVIYNWANGENGPILIEVFEDDGLAPFDVNDHMAWFYPTRNFSQVTFSESGECTITVHTLYIP